MTFDPEQTIREVEGVRVCTCGSIVMVGHNQIKVGSDYCPSHPRRSSRYVGVKTADQQRAVRRESELLEEADDGIEG